MNPMFCDVTYSLPFMTSPICLFCDVTLAKIPCETGNPMFCDVTYPLLIFCVYSVTSPIHGTLCFVTLPIHCLFFVFLFGDVALPLLIFYVFVSYACIKGRLLLVCVIR